MNDTSNIWTREDTRLWIHEVQLKLEAIEHCLDETTAWCEVMGVEGDDKLVFVLSFLTLLWVGYQFGEPSSKQQIFEILKIPEWEKVDDQLFVLPAKYGDLSQVDMLHLAMTTQLGGNGGIV